jgi:hypothetical protein
VPPLASSIHFSGFHVFNAPRIVKSAGAAWKRVMQLSTLPGDENLGT